MNLYMIGSFFLALAARDRVKSRKASKKYCYFHTHTDKIVVFFLRPNSFKKGKLLGTEFFSSVAEFFFWIGQPVPQRVGNTGCGV
jgi:hypothetical protein